MDQTIEVGAVVVATDGEVGTVEEVVVDPATNAPRVLVVRATGGERWQIPYDLVASESTAREVRLGAARAELTAYAAQATAAAGTLETVGDHLIVPVREEVLVPTTRPIELGEVRIHKRVETVPYETLVGVTRDDVDVERVALNRSIDAVPGPRQEGNTLVIPVVEEVLVTEKRLVLREEIRVTRRQVSEQVRVAETLRREVVEIEDPEGGTTRAGGSAGRTAASGGAGDLPLT